ncbi:MAG: hypothetical protein OEY03_04710, partial [Rhizobacter sp.]|nr:hypothetical protein [Rhizobacter sp.]
MTFNHHRQTALLGVLSSLLLAGCATLPEPVPAPAPSPSASVQTAAAPSAIVSPPAMQPPEDAMPAEAIPASAEPAAGRFNDTDGDDSATVHSAAADHEGLPAPTEIAGAVPVAPVPVDPLRPEVRVVLNAREAQADLWERVRR